MSNYPFTKNELRAAVAAVRNADLAVLPVAAPVAAFSERSEVRVRTAIRKAKGKRAFRKTVSGIAVALGIAILGGATFLTVDADARDAFKTWLREVYENQIVYRFTENGDASILDRVSVGWVPEGYELVFTDRIEGQSVSYVYENKKDESGFVLSFDLMNDGFVTTFSEASGDRLSTFVIDGKSAEYYDDTEGHSDNLIVFDEPNSLVISLDGYLDLQVMKKIIENISIN